MAQQVKTLASKPSNLSLILETQQTEEIDNLLTTIGMLRHACAHTHKLNQ